MSLKRALFASAAMGVAAIATAAEVSFYDEALPSSFNPLYAESMVDYRAQELAFDRLYYNDPITNELVSRVVKTWSVASRTQVKLTLKDGLKWQDEKPVTANDICFTIDAMLNPKTTSPRANVFSEFFKGCQVDENDDLSALIEFTQVFYKPKSKLNFSLLPAHKFKSTAISPTDRFGSQPWGSGAYKGGKGKRGAIFRAHRKSKHHSPKIDAMNMKSL